MGCISGVGDGFCCLQVDLQDAPSLLDRKELVGCLAGSVGCCCCGTDAAMRVCVCVGGVGMQQSTYGCQTPSEAASMEEEPPVVVGSPSSLLPGPQVNLGLTTITKYFSYSKLWRKL